MVRSLVVVAAASFVVPLAAQSPPVDKAKAEFARAEKAVFDAKYAAAHALYKQLAARHPNSVWGRMAALRTQPTAYLGWGDLQRNGAANNRVDVVVMGGLDLELPLPPAVHDGTIAVHAGRQGQRLVQIDLELDAPGEPHDEGDWSRRESERDLRAKASDLRAKIKAWESDDYCRSRLGLPGAMGAIDPARINPNGSSLATGHPFAATGARIVATAAKELAQRGRGRCLVSICTAGGMGVVAILER